jgi:nucleoside-diphosphate-sugar epimerase
MNTVLVTGAAGYTGGRLAAALAAGGTPVRALVLPGSDTAALEANRAEIVFGDLTRPETLDAAVRGVETVYHIAAVYREENVPRSLFWDVNVTGTKNLLEASERAGVGRFVHCSTVGVQGDIADPPATEEAPVNPGDHYQESKLEGERLALRFCREKGFPVAVFRPVGIYGPGDTRFLKMFRMVKKRAPLIGSGNVLYHLTYIDDLVEGIRLVGKTPGIEGQVFTLAGPRYTTLNELFDIIGRVLGVKPSNRRLPVWPAWLAAAACEAACRPFRIPPPIYRRRLDFFIKDRAFDISKARRVLGYNPSIDLEEGLARTAAWYKEKGLI